MSTVTLRIEERDKEELTELCALMGMSVNTFYTICTKKAIETWGIPFDVKVKRDKFYSESNMNALNHSFEQEKRGEIVSKTMEELEALANA